MHSSRRFFSLLFLAAAEDLPRNGPSFILFHGVTSGGEKGGGNVSKLLKIQSYRGAGATAEVKQSESCRQSFNLKRAGSPWGHEGSWTHKEI